MPTKRRDKLLTPKARLPGPASSAGTAPSKKPLQSWWLALMAVFLLALTLRGLYQWGQAERNPTFRYPQMDGWVHHEWAQHIAQGEGMEARPYFRAPLYYYLLGGLYWVAGPSVVAARMAGIILGALNCCLIACLGRTLGGGRVGLVAGLLAALYWPLIYFDGELLTVGVEVFLDVSLLITLLWARRGERNRRFLLWGLSGGWLRWRARMFSR